MTDKETENKEIGEIDEMKQIACNALNNDNCPECGDDRCIRCRRIARMFKQAGYRKADKVYKEATKRIYQKLYDLCTRDDNPFHDYDLCAEDILEWAKADGVEVDA